MRYVYDDGGREAAGFKGKAGDCCVRAFAIASGRPYQEVYDLVNGLAASERTKKRGKSNARTGVFKPTAHKLAYELLPKWLPDGTQGWTPTMKIGQGCKVHLRDGELPMGKLVVSVSRHYVAVIDGVIHDTFDPSRLGNRCVYGYWTFA